MTKKWRILLLDTKKQNPNHYIALGIFNALQQHQDVELVIKADYGNAVIQARDNNCNLFFAFDGEQVEPSICMRLRNICGKSIVWNVEDPYEIAINKTNSMLFDLVFTNDKACVEEYGSKGRHLPLGACPNLHFHEINQNKLRYDLFFAGTAWPNRVSLLKSIEQGIDDIKLKLALPTNEHLPKINLNLNSSAYNWRTPNSEFARFANHSAVTLSLHRQFTASEGRSEAGTPGPRLFEVAMAGGFQLVDRDIPGISDYFVEGKDFAAFSSPEECLDKLKYYLEHSDEREKIAVSAQKKVKEKHTYLDRISIILNEISKFELVSSESNITKNKVVLVVCHNTINNTPYGGVEIYLDILNRNINNEFDIYYYVPDQKSPEGQRYLLLDSQYCVVDEVKFASPLPTTSEHMLSCEQRERAFGALLNKYDVDLVHYQHLIRHVPSLPYISKAYGIPSIFSMHDYFPISHRFNLIDNTGRYRNTTFNSLRNIDICLSDSDNIEPGSQAKRMAFWGTMLETFDVIHTNSSATKNMLISSYPNLDLDKIVIRGIPFDNNFDYNHVKSAPIDSEYLNVLVLGNFTTVKGADTLLQVFNETRNSSIKFHVHGQIAPEYESVIDSLKFEHVVFHGEYNNDQLPEILSGKHVSLHLSIWPETYCITLSEAWNSGLVPIVTDLGALGERVTKKYGFKVKVEDVGDPVEILESLQLDCNLLSQLRNNIKQAHLVETATDHKEWLINLYQDLLPKACTSGLDTATNLNGATNQIDLVTCGVKLNSIFWATIRHQTIILPAQNRTVSGSVPRRPYYLVKFMIGQLRNRGFKVTLLKVISKIKTRALGRKRGY
ncbi:glycosyltransferase [Vibrio cyclitrophicus]